MSFEAQETSLESGQPVDLLEISIGLEAWYYCNNQVQLVVDGRTYTPLEFRRTRLQHSHESSGSDRMEVALPSTTPFVERFLTAAPGRRPSVALKRVHRVDLAGGVVVEYRGVVQSIDFEENGDRAKLQIAALTAANSRSMPRRTYQGLCGHMLYDSFCGISETNPAWEKHLTCLGASGQNVELNGAGGFGYTDFFVNGFVEFNGDFRMVIEQTGDTLKLLLPFPSSPVGQVLRVLAGCKHRLGADCVAKFNNRVNYGGFPYVPTKNIFSTGIN